VERAPRRSHKVLPWLVVDVSKRLVICCDGTWNSPDQVRGGKPAPTNVVKVALAVAPTDSTGQEQRIFYHQGVGTDRWDRVRGGMFGFGLSRDVRDTYRFLVQNFSPGDEIFFFGFSRGAYTARSTAGFVRNCGILRRDEANRVDEAYALYRSRNRRTRPRGIEAQLFMRSYSHETRIRFIGVWDTVGALGIPLSGLPLVNLINRKWQFHDTELSPTVDAAFQALAIDEQRGPFRPAIWTTTSDQLCEQVWFPGAHSDIGGGNPDPALSEIALLWIAQRARACGLAFEADAFSPLTNGAEEDLRHTGEYVAPNPNGPLHASRTGCYRLLPPFVRPIGLTGREYVAAPAIARLQQTNGYAPANLLTHLRHTHQIMQVDLNFRSRVTALGPSIRLTVSPDDDLHRTAG
jgi:uncharacterized protein (DUF2235 family)